jgi:hypothetical protein
VADRASRAECAEHEPFTATWASQFRYVTDGAHVGAAAVDLDTNCRYELGDNEAFPMASTAKVELMAALFLKLQDGGDESDADLDDLVRRMIDESDNDAADVLYERIGGPLGLQYFGQRLGLHATDNLQDGWGSSLTTPGDQLNLLRTTLVGNGALDDQWVDKARLVMSIVNRDQAWGIGAAADPFTSVMFKNGWYDLGADDGPPISRVNSIGLIEPAGGHRILLSVYGDDWTTIDSGATAIEALTHHVVATLTGS